MLHKERENFEQIILKVSEDTGIDASIVEKDYYVTLFLKRIVEVISYYLQNVYGWKNERDNMI